MAERKPEKTSGKAGAARTICPLCGKPAAARYRPFCSRRCADLDLGRWLDGAYRVPSNEPAPDAETTGDEED